MGETMLGKSKFVYDIEDVLIVEHPDDLVLLSAPRSLRDPRARRARNAYLDQHHVTPLTAYVRVLRAEDIGYVPSFDPFDGGTTARRLFLMEKPEPRTDPNHPVKAGSGFISRDNDDPTAEAVFTFMMEAGIARRDTVLWNGIPWWNGSTAISAAEWKKGLNRLDSLLALLPELRAVVMVGKKAARARETCEARGLRVFVSSHPSPINKAANRPLWDLIPDQWAKAAAAVL